MVSHLTLSSLFVCKKIEVLSSCKLRGYTSRVFCILWIHSTRLVLLFQAPGIVNVHVDCIISLTRSSTFFINSLIASSIPLFSAFSSSSYRLGGLFKLSRVYCTVWKGRHRRPFQTFQGLLHGLKADVRRPFQTFQCLLHGLKSST